MMRAPWVGEDCVVRCPYQDSMAPLPDGCLTDILLKALQDKADTVVFTDGQTGETMTAHQLLDRGRRVASGLRQRGFLPGEVLCVCAPNSLHIPVLILATLLNGGILSLSPEISNTDILELHVTSSRATLVIAGRDQAEKMQHVVAKVKHVKNLFIIGEDRKGFISFSKLLIDSKDKDTVHSKVDRMKDVAMICSSSGTTGPCKPIMLTHYALISRILQQRDSRALSSSRKEVVMIEETFATMSGVMEILVAFISDNQTVIIPSFLTELTLSTIQKYKVNSFFGFLPMMEKMANSPKIQEFDLSSVKVIRYGGTVIPFEKVKVYIEKMGCESSLHQLYGSTEAGFMVGYMGGQRPPAVGQVIENVQLKVIDIKTKRILGPNEEGEICVSSPSATIGYYRNEKATRELIHKDGFLRTGDIGYYDEDGYIYIINRLSECIWYKNQMVKASEVECLLRTHPCVHDAAVVGRHSEDLGELPIAFIVVKPDSQVTTEQIQHYMAINGNALQQLPGGVVFLDHIPRGCIAGKILRLPLRKMAQEM